MIARNKYLIAIECSKRTGFTDEVVVYKRFLFVFFKTKRFCIDMKEAVNYIKTDKYYV